MTSKIPSGFIPDGWFPKDTKDNLLARVAEWWDLNHALPFPRQVFGCPVCGSTKQTLRYWKFHAFSSSAGKKTWPYRVDVSFKCTRCSYVTVFGVPIPKEMWEPFALNSTVTASDYMSDEILPPDRPESAAIPNWRAQVFNEPQQA